MRYTNEQISQINNSINVVNYASQFLDLQIINGEYWCCCLWHDDDINPSLSFNKEKNTFYCFGCDAKGSTIQFIMKYHKLTFPEAIEYMIKYANISISHVDHSDVLDYLQKQNIKKKNIKTIERKILPTDIMDKYKKDNIKEWADEGILQSILDEYNVRYDLQNNKIVFPIKDADGNIISIKARTLYVNYKDLGIPKYIYYQPIGTNDFLFGLWKNKKHIMEVNECLIFESEKSVMKMNSWGFNNALATCTKKINDKQIEILLSLKCNLVFAFDKDVKQKEIIKELSMLSKFTNVFYIYDKSNLLGEKDSPCDKTKDIWNELYNNKIKL